MSLVLFKRNCGLLSGGCRAVWSSRTSAARDSARREWLGGCQDSGEPQRQRNSRHWPHADQLGVAAHTPVVWHHGELPERGVHFDPCGCVDLGQQHAAARWTVLDGCGRLQRRVLETLQAGVRAAAKQLLLASVPSLAKARGACPTTARSDAHTAGRSPIFRQGRIADCFGDFQVTKPGVRGGLAFARRMSILLVVALAAMQFTGCASLTAAPPHAEVIAPPAPEQEVTVLYVSLLGVAQDPVTGEAVPALCAGPSCLNFTPKVLQIPQPSAPSRPAPPAVSPPVKPPAAVQPEPRQIEMRLPFSYNSSRLSKASQDELLRVLLPVSTSARSVQIIGVADSQKRDQYNLSLAQRRADAVASFLKTHLASATFSTSARVVKVSEQGAYPQDEPHQARRADLSVLLFTNTQ